jgi:uncharacterized protein RhaS with RHS repeats
MYFDPRDDTDERDPRDRNERDRDHDDALTMGRGSNSQRVEAHHDERRDRVFTGQDSKQIIDAFLASARKSVFSLL